MDWKAELPKKLREVVRLRAHGYTPEQIGDELCLGRTTVQNYIQEAREIADCDNAVQLAAWYFYKYGNISKDFAPITKRIGKFFILAIIAIGSTQIDCERMFRTARRGRRREDIELIG